MRLRICLLAVVLACGTPTTWAQENQNQVPEIVVEPTAPSTTVTPQDPFDLPFSFPSLRDQTFDGLGGVTRGETSLFDLPSAVDIVNRQALEEKQARDMFQALQYETGVLMQRTAAGQAQPTIRGLLGQQVLILVDGIRMNNATFRSGPNQYFNLVDPGMVERIEVIRGPGSVLWGSDALGGVINIVTRSGNPHRADYNGGSFKQYISTADSASYSRANVEGWVGQTGYFGGGMYNNVNEVDTAGALGRQPGTDYSQYSGDIKLNRLLDDYNMLTVALQHFEQEDLPRSDRFPPFSLGPPVGTIRPTFLDQQRDLAYIRLEGFETNNLIDAYQITASIQRQKEGVLEDRGAELRQFEFDADMFGLQMVFAKELNYGRLTYGTDFFTEDVSAVRFNRLTGVQAQPQFPTDSTYERLGVFLNYDAPLTDNLNVVTGVRYENIDASGTIGEFSATPVYAPRNFNDWIANIGLIYELTDQVHLVGGFYEGFRAPNWDDLYTENPVVAGTGNDNPSPNVQPEHSYTYEIGMKVDARRFRGQAFVYWTDLQDAIQRVVLDPGPPTEFVKDNFDTYINGTELDAEYLFDGGWSVFGNFAYVYGVDTDRNVFYSRIPPTQGIAGLRWRDEYARSYFEFFAWMVREQDRYNPSNVGDPRFPVGGTPGYTTLNMRMGTSLGESNQHRVSLSLENLGDTDYRVLGSGVDGVGFNAIFGYEWIR